jgi:hypothetical protein
MKIEITGHSLRYRIGTIVDMANAKAESLVKAGIAKIVNKREEKDEPEKLSTKKK